MGSSLELWNLSVSVLSENGPYLPGFYGSSAQEFDPYLRLPIFLFQVHLADSSVKRLMRSSLLVCTAIYFELLVAKISSSVNKFSTHKISLFSWHLSRIIAGSACSHVWTFPTS